MIQASIIISTYNRRDALLTTLQALERQDIPVSDFEVIVTDDGSQDGTIDLLRSLTTNYELIPIRQAVNQGVSAGRNVAIRRARGRVLVFVSDDVIVPEDFLRLHIETHDGRPNSWVVGGFRQLPALRESSFGRYVESLEDQMEDARRVEQIEPGVWELSSPTARNLSIPAEHFEEIGLFDEHYRIACEDQDLAHRAEPLGVRFLFNEAIHCLHNDQEIDVGRFGRHQERAAYDGVRFLTQYAHIHGDAPFFRVNGPTRAADPPAMIAKKAVKRGLARPSVLAALGAATRVAERLGARDGLLWPAYRVMLGLYIFRGFRTGIRDGNVPEPSDSSPRESDGAAVARSVAQRP